MTSLSLPAYGKINLSLDVLGLRPDGYHELASVMQSIKLSDYITFESNNSGKITLACSEPVLSTGEDNLVIKAAKLLQERFCPEKGVDIFLDKKIPIAAGLGGGSSDAATVMRALNCLWGLGLTTTRLISLGCKIGADVAFCLVGGTALAQGIGEKLTLLAPAPRLWLVLVKPGQGLRAGDIYGEWDQQKWNTNNCTPGLLEVLASGCRHQLASRLGNDLERVVRFLLPEVEELIQTFQQRGAIRAMVSGSGPTVFGIMEGETEAIALADYFRQYYEEVHVTHTI